MTLSTSSCFLFNRAPLAFRPPPIPARPAPVIPPLVMELPAEALWNFPILASLPTIPLTLDLPAPRIPAPPKRPPVAVAPKTVPVPVVSDPQPEAPPPPRLGQVFTAEQLRDYNRSYDESLDRVRKAVQVIEKKSLNADQAQMLESIRAFQKQAEQAHEQDLLTAVNLARRADLLARDLLGRLP
jgi:hypothetical protein